MHVKTSIGFEANIDEGFVDDIVFIEGINALQAGDATAIPLVTRKILGDAKDALYDFVKDEHGRVPVKPTLDIVAEIVAAVSGSEPAGD